MADEAAVIDQTTESDQDLSTAAETQELDQAESQTENQESTQQTEADKVDGRRFNPEWSKALKELRELYPDKADMLTKMRDNYARYQALQEVAPKGLEDVRAWKSTLDALGGSEAAADLMQRVADVEQVDAKIEAGDYSVIAELPESMQKGFYQMLPDALAELSTKDPQAFAAAVMPHFAAALQDTGMEAHLQKMYQAAGDNEPLKELIKQQYDWYQAQVQGKGTMPGGTKTASPEVQRLQAELNSRREADDQSFIGGVAEKTNQYVTESFAKNAEVYLKQLSLTDAQKSDLAESFNVKLVDKLAGDTAFQKQLAAYKSLKNRNPETVNSYIRSKIDESAKAIIDGLVTARYGGMRKAKPTTLPSTTTTDAGAVRVAKTPDQSEWDMDKMDAVGYDQTAKIGKFFLKGNRTVQVVRA
jgi:hypothetical protein